MDDDERHRVAELRVRAARAKLEASAAQFAISLIEASAAIRVMGKELQASFDGEIASHPDLAELNVRMDAMYELDGRRQ